MFPTPSLSLMAAAVRGAFEVIPSTLNWASAPSTLIPPNFSLTRSGATASLVNYPDKLVVPNVPANLVRPVGARVVRNLLANSEAPGLGIVSTATFPPTINNSATYLGETCCSIAFPSGVAGFANTEANGPASAPITVGKSYRGSFRLCFSRPLTGSEQVTVYFTGSYGFQQIVFGAALCPTAFTRLTPSTAEVSIGTGAVGIYAFVQSALSSPVTLYLQSVQFEEVTGQSNQNPSEYVSVGVLSAPYHGMGVDGWKAFSTANGNTVASNVVTEATGASLGTFDGTLVDGAATNSALQSQDFATTWTPADANTSVSTNAAIAPDGTLTADKIQEATTTSATHYVNQNITTTAASWAFSVYLKAAERSYALVQMSGNYRIFNLASGTLGVTTDGTSTATIEPAGNGWYRCTVIGVMTAVSSIFRVWVSNADSIAAYAGTANSGIYAWGAQAETGRAATSYIPTTTVAVTRSADVLTAPTSGLLANAQGFAAIGYRAVAGESTSSECVISTYDGAGGIPLRRSTTALALFDGTANRALGLVLPNVAGTIYKAATTWGGSSCNGAVNGVAGTPATFDGSMDLGATLRIGDNVSTISLPLSMVLQSLRLGTLALGTNQLVTASTP